MPRSIQKEFPHIFIDWHPTLNGKVNPSSLRRTSHKKYWWRCHKKNCGCNWQATIYSRIRLEDTCPKCEKRKNTKFTSDVKDVKRILSQIKRLQSTVDKQLDVFIDDNSTILKKQISSVFVRRKIDEINKLGVNLRKIILNHRKKMIGYKKEVRFIKKTKTKPNDNCKKNKQKNRK